MPNLQGFELFLQGYLPHSKLIYSLNTMSVTNAARSLANSMDDILGFSVPEEGSLSHADEYMPDFMELMDKGIKDSKRVLLNTIRDLADTIVHRINDMLNEDDSVWGK